MKNKLSKMRLCDWLLIGLTILSLASSIQLEFTHCTSISWVWSHVIIATSFIVLIGWHLYLHFQRRNWVKMLRVQKSPVTRMLGIFCILTIISAIIAFIKWVNVYSHTIAGGIHGKIGFLFLAICIAHTIKRIKSPILKNTNR